MKINLLSAVIDFDIGINKIFPIFILMDDNCENIMKEWESCIYNCIDYYDYDRNSNGGSLYQSSNDTRGDSAGLLTMIKDCQHLYKKHTDCIDKK